MINLYLASEARLIIDGMLAATRCFYEELLGCLILEL